VVGVAAVPLGAQPALHRIVRIEDVDELLVPDGEAPRRPGVVIEHARDVRPVRYLLRPALM
jgi:hypothetical protein